MAARRVVIVRHANSTKPATKDIADDKVRQITDVGKGQGLAVRKQLQDAGFKFGLALVSPVDRCRQLAEIVMGTTDCIREVAELYPPMKGDGTEDGEILGEAFGRLGYVPLAQYHKEEAARDMLGRFGQRASDAIVDALDDTDDDILVVNHAVCAAAIALAYSGGNYDGEDAVREVNLGECQAIVLNTSDGRILVLETC